MIEPAQTEVCFHAPCLSRFNHFETSASATVTRAACWQSIEIRTLFLSPVSNLSLPLGHQAMHRSLSALIFGSLQDFERFPSEVHSTLHVSLQLPQLSQVLKGFTLVNCVMASLPQL